MIPPSETKLMEEKKKQPININMGRRLIIFPLPLHGHVTPMLQLATLLHSKGFSITVIHTRHKSPDPTNFPDFTFHFIDDGLPDNAAPSPGYYSLVPALIKRCSDPFRACLSGLLNADQHPNREPFSCLISDPLWLFAGAVADTFNLPRMVVHTGSISTFLVYHSLPLLLQMGYFPFQETKMNEFVVDLPPFKVKDLPTEQCHEFAIEIVTETKSSQGIICNTFKELESTSLTTVQQALSVPVFSIGPLYKCLPTNASSLRGQDQASISWLNKQAPKSVLYVSFGTLAVINDAELHEMAWGLADSMQPFLWVVRPGLILSSEASDLLPKAYMEVVHGRGHIVKWAPQHEVLAHPAVGGFWTHCGWNSTLESISEGVPMICQPFFVDQALNARLVSDNWRVGLQLEKGVTREDIAKAIRRLMVEQESQEVRNRAAMLKENATLCQTAGGSSYESLERLTSYLSTF